MTCRRYNLPSLLATSCTLLLLLLLSSSSPSHAQPQKKQQDRPLPTIGDTLHQVCDKDKNSKVTMNEINAQLKMLEGLFTSVGQDNMNERESEYMELFTAVRAGAPQIFELLDSNNDKSLTKKELSYVTKFEKTLMKDGGMRDLLRDIMSMLDINNDDLLSIDELVEGSNSDEILSKVADRVHDLLPIRNSSTELHEFVKKTIESITGGESSLSIDKESIAKGIAWIDDDNDQHISRKEIGKYYNLAGKKFLEVSKTIKQMGPMLAMFDGMQMDGAGMGGAGMGGRPKTEF